MRTPSSNNKRPPHRVNSNRITLNVSGEIYETLPDTLSRYPSTVLGNLNEQHAFYCPVTRQYFFHRNRLCFGAILFFYQSQGILRCPNGIPLDIFEEECLYFQIPDRTIQLMKHEEGIVAPVVDEDVPRQRFPSTTMKSKLWDLLEQPESSVFACWYGIFILGAITLSIWTICLATTPLINNNKQSVKHVQLIDLILNIYFLGDVILRVLVAPHRKEFMQWASTWVDILSCTAYFLSLHLTHSNNTSLLNFFIFIRVLRVLRLFRLSKHFRRLQVAGEILIACAKDLRLFLVCLVLIVIFYGSLMQFLERDKSFVSMLHACWWAVQTITTVGYGDIVPVTVAGKLFAGCFMAFGTQLTLLPVLTIVNKFTSLYTDNVFTK